MDRAEYLRIWTTTQQHAEPITRWALANRQPGESLRDARKRHPANQDIAARRAILAAIANRKTTTAEQMTERPAVHDLVDDGEDDALWHLDRTRRRYRVRPLRPYDKWNGPRAGLLLLIDCQEMEGLVVRADILGRPAEDSDDWASSVFALREWSRIAEARMAGQGGDAQ